MSDLARSISALGPGRALIRVKKARGGEAFDAVSAAIAHKMDPRFIDELRKHAPRGRPAIAWGEVCERPLIRLDNVTLCRQFGFNPALHAFDMSSSAAGTGSTQVGYGGSTRGNRAINGFVFLQNADGKPDRNRDPVATWEILTESTTVRDVDPQNRSDFERL